MDPIQAGVFEVKRQAKKVKFNVSVFCASMRESSRNFSKIRDDDMDLDRKLKESIGLALSRQSGDEASPSYWSFRVDSHAMSMGTFSKLYSVMIAALGLSCTYLFTNDDMPLLVVSVLTLFILTKAKWGIDKYCEALNRISLALKDINR
ncbi:hypothetical protein RE428_10440 [Marinobacter nanhaiticus D15-8W]|uniref:Uncharacterized protein n=1 Tax=Marinobacter nanhaiticus D15-8W TaxID=626887 RepID=A0A371CG49_9GAMM|nr:hypothetical protein [Marinobacter nanhaiticus]RDW95411.1 hypothetical protein J057_24410 [Marinobacter nanhaiticus D15-8W]BES70026.1 hypothetical protein RE428_10440 [Marinobacter nanhaiticus D15-8W]